jgi:hypothetical protein
VLRTNIEHSNDQHDAIVAPSSAGRPRGKPAIAMEEHCDATPRSCVA